MRKNLKQLRKDAGLSLEKLAKLTQIGKSTLGNYETGRSDMSPDKVAVLAKCLKTSPEIVGRKVERFWQSCPATGEKGPVTEEVTDIRLPQAEPAESLRHAQQAWALAKSKGRAGQFDALMLNLSRAMGEENAEWHTQQVKDILDKLTAKGDNP